MVEKMVSIDEIRMKLGLSARKIEYIIANGEIVSYKCVEESLSA